MNGSKDKVSHEMTSDALSSVRLQAFDSSYVRSAKTGEGGNPNVLLSFQQELSYAQKLSSELIIVPRIEHLEASQLVLKYEPGPHLNLAEIVEQICSSETHWALDSAFIIIRDIFSALERISECPPERIDKSVGLWGHGCFDLRKVIVTADGATKLLDARFPATGLPETMSPKTLPFRAPEFNLAMSKGTPAMDVFSVAAVALLVISPKLHSRVSMQTDFTNLANSSDTERIFDELELKPVLQCLQRALSVSVQDRFDALTQFREAIEQRWSPSQDAMKKARFDLHRFFGEEPGETDLEGRIPSERDIAAATNPDSHTQSRPSQTKNPDVSTGFDADEESVTDIVAAPEIEELERRIKKQTVKLTPLLEDTEEVSASGVHNPLPADFEKIEPSADLTGQIESAVQSLDFSAEDNDGPDLFGSAIQLDRVESEVAREADNSNITPVSIVPDPKEVSKATEEAALELDENKNILEHNRRRNKELKIRSERQQKRREEFSRRRFNKRVAVILFVIMGLCAGAYCYTAVPGVRRTMDKAWSAAKSKLGFTESRARIWLENDDRAKPNGK